MLRPFDPFRETMHDTTGLSPYIETDFRYGRKPVSISSEGICLPHTRSSASRAIRSQIAERTDYL